MNHAFRIFVKKDVICEPISCFKGFPLLEGVHEAEVGAEANFPSALYSTIKMNKHRGYRKADTIMHLK